jgi:hypothetical protein
LKPKRPPHDQPCETSRHVEQSSVLAQAQESEICQRLAEMEADPAMRIPFTEADAEKCSANSPIPVPEQRPLFALSLLCLGAYSRLP